MSRLKAVCPQTVSPQKPKLIIFGKAGAGKTFTSLDFPNCYYIDSEAGATRNHYTDKLSRAGGVYLGVEQGANNFKEVIEQVKALATEKHEYKTLIIDSISHLANIEIAKEAERLGDKDAFGASKKPAIAYQRSLVNWLDRLDMNVILIAHEKAEWANEKQVGVTYDAWEKLEYILDLTLNIKKQGDSRKAFIKKSRLEGFPDGGNFEWSYKEFAERYGRAVIERVSAPIKLATPEQLAEVKILLETYKLKEGVMDKWLAAAKCDKLDDMDSDKLDKIINYIKEGK